MNLVSSMQHVYFRITTSIEVIVAEEFAKRIITFLDGKEPLVRERLWFWVMGRSKKRIFRIMVVGIRGFGKSFGKSAGIHFPLYVWIYGKRSL
jgi:hypothetical protein